MQLIEECDTIKQFLPYSNFFKTHKETFAATNFTTKPTHEWTKWLSAIGWLAHGLANAH